MFQFFSTPGVSSISYFLAIVGFSAYSIARTKNRSHSMNLEIALMYAIGITGFSGVSNFIVHAFWGDVVARSIGWPAGNPFQLEVAGANLAIGLIGFLGFWRRDFWLPYLTAKAIFGWTAGIVHIIDIIGRGNMAVGNAGPILYLDFLVPAALLALYAVYMRAADDPSGLIRTQPLATRRT